MKKIFAIFAALIMTIMATAQNYEYPGVFGMPYVNLNAGAVSTDGLAPLVNGDFDTFVGNIAPTVGLEFGTYFTPVWGASIEGMANFNLTKDASSVVSRSAVLTNGKLNVSNFIAGYKGYPRRVELVAVGGIGWGHDFAAADDPAFRDPNYVVYNTGLELNANLGAKRAWQISVRPTVLWNNYDNNPKFNVNDGQVRLTVGVTYKFGNRKIKSHNFVTNDYAVSQHDYDVLMAKYEECHNRPAEVKEVPVEVLREVEVVRTIEVSPNVKTVLTFPIGSTKLSKVEHAKLGALARSIMQTEKVYIVGSADTKTGTRTRNEKLAKERAEVVKTALVKEFGIAEDRIITDWNFDTDELPEASRAAIISLYTEQNSGE